MRSSKSRSRSKSNRNRSVGNVVNRVFDSSGPEGKVRGTPQQIIDKYNQLARDAQLSNDRVATENFQQHSEHYLRMLAGAMKEQAERQAQQQQHQQDRQKNNPQQGRDGRRDERDEGQQARGEQRQAAAEQPAVDAKASDVIDVKTEDSALVETPENRAPRQRRRKPAPAAETAASDEQPAPPADAAE